MLFRSTIFVRTTRFVQTAFPQKRMDSTNISRIAGLLDPLWESYQEITNGCRPDLVVVNLGNNDNPETFRLRLNDILNLNAKRKIRTILLLEANSPGAIVAPALSKHGIMKELGTKYDVPVLDLHGFVKEESNKESGFLWWDTVHLTSYGQGLVAKWLAPALTREIRKRY